MNYIPLNIKTHYELLSSIIKIEDLIIFAKKYSIESLGITDSNMFGCIEFYNACKRNNIKPIIGLEIELDTKIVLYAKDNIGYKNLIKLSTLQSEKKLNFDDLNKYNNGLICIVPYESLNLYNDLKEKLIILFIT